MSRAVDRSEGSTSATTPQTPDEPTVDIPENFEGVEDIFIEGDIGDFEGDGEVPKNDILTEASRVHVDGDITARRHVLKDAFNAVVEGDINYTSYVGLDAVNARVLGDINHVRNVFNGSENVRIHGDIAGGADVLKNTVDSHVRGDVDGNEILVNAQDSSIIGDVSGVNDILSRAEGSWIRGDVSGLRVMNESKDSVIRGSIDADHLLSRSENSLVVGEEIKVENDLGREAQDSIVAAPEVDADDIREGVHVISESGEHGSSYEGDWEKMFQFVEGELETLTNVIGVFNLDFDFAGFNEFRDEIERLGSWYSEEIEQTSEFVDEISEYVDIDLPEDNREIYEFLEDGEQRVREEVEDEWNLSSRSSEELFESDDRDYLLKALGSTDGEDIECAPDERFEDWFLKSFILEEGGNEDALIEVGRDNSYEFQQTRKVDPKSQEQDINEDRQQKLYNDGLDLLDDIRTNSRRYSLDEEVLEMEEVSEVQEELEEVRNELQEIRRGLDTGESSYEEVQDRMSEVNQREEELEDELIETYVEQVANAREIDLENPDRSELSEILRQVQQHALPERSSTWEDVRNITEELEAEDDELTSNEINVEYWDKTGELPATDDYFCCAFKGGVRQNTLPEWMADRNTQFLKIQNGENKAMAITRIAESDDETYLVVDSVESAYNNVFQREDVVRECTAAIDEFAEKASMGEEDIDAIAYNRDPNNSAPEDFIKNMDESEYEKSEIELEKRGDDVYSEVDFSNLDSYVKRLDA